jgi:hypothetical protein
MKEITDSENEKRMNKIAEEMAVYFDKKIKTSDLAEWTAITDYTCIEFKSDRDLDHDPVLFLHTIGWLLLPGLIDCKTERERIDFLKEGLINLFQCEFFDGTKALLLEIDCCYQQQIKKYDYDEGIDVYRHMLIYNTFLSILEMYKEYEKLRISNDSNQAA